MQSTLQHFRVQLVLHAQIRDLFLHSLELARTRGLLKGRSLQVALHTTPILRRGPRRTPNYLLADIRHKQGVSWDRILSVHDPEMCHGRKSNSQSFDGHKAAVAVDPPPRGPSQFITVVAVLLVNGPDAQCVLELMAHSERDNGVPVTATIADAAYGDGYTRQNYVDAPALFPL